MDHSTKMQCQWNRQAVASLPMQKMPLAVNGTSVVLKGSTLAQP